MHIVCKRPRKMGREGSTKTYKVIGAWRQYGTPPISHLTKTSYSMFTTCNRTLTTREFERKA
jgi:hypothetical protein